MKKFAMIISVLFLVSTISLADEIVDIYLKDGNIFKQLRVIEAKENILSVKDKYSGSPKFSYNDIKDIVFPGGNIKQKGIVLVDGVLSGKLKSYVNGEWVFILPSGILTVNQPNKILSIDFIHPEAEIKYLPDNVRVTSIIEWMENRYLVEPDIVSDSNVTVKLVKTVITSDKLLITFQTKSNDNLDKECRIESFWVDEKERMSKKISQNAFFPIRNNAQTSLSYDPLIDDAGSLTFNFNFIGECKPNNWVTTPPIDINWLKAKQ